MSNITTDQIGELIAQGGRSGRVTRELLQAFLRNPQGYTNGKPSEYSVTIDYAKSVVEQMKFDGQYNWSNDNINGENFPVTGEGTVEVNLELVHLNKVASTEEVESYLEANGLRAATIAELLASGATYPDVQREFPIVGLGSSWVDRNGDRSVPYLSSRGTRRRLGLVWLGGQWDGVCRFLAVRK